MVPVCPSHHGVKKKTPLHLQVTPGVNPSQWIDGELPPSIALKKSTTGSYSSYKGPNSMSQIFNMFHHVTIEQLCTFQWNS